MKRFSEGVDHRDFNAAFVVSYQGNIFEADTPGQILTELTGVYFQDEDPITRWMVRGKFARQWLNTYATEQRRAEILSGDRKLEANYISKYADSEEQAEHDLVEWNDETIAQVDIETDRKLFRSLVALDELSIMEREDVFYFRNGGPWEDSYQAGQTSCASCRFFRKFADSDMHCVDMGIDVHHGHRVSADAPVGKYCQAFAPLHDGDGLEQRMGSRYVPVSAEMIHIPHWQVNYVTEE